MLLLKRRWPIKNCITLFTSNSKFRLNLTQRVTGSLVSNEVVPSYYLECLLVINTNNGINNCFLYSFASSSVRVQLSQTIWSEWKNLLSTIKLFSVLFANIFVASILLINDAQCVAPKTIIHGMKSWLYAWRQNASHPFTLNLAV